MHKPAFCIYTCVTPKKPGQSCTKPVTVTRADLPSLRVFPLFCRPNTFLERRTRSLLPSGGSIDRSIDFHWNIFRARTFEKKSKSKVWESEKLFSSSKVEELWLWNFHRDSKESPLDWRKLNTLLGKFIWKSRRFERIRENLLSEVVLRRNRTRFIERERKDLSNWRI